MMYVMLLNVMVYFWFGNFFCLKIEKKIILELKKIKKMFIILEIVIKNLIINKFGLNYDRILKMYEKYGWRFVFF